MTSFPGGLGAIVDAVDLVVMDLWGCMHDGIVCYPAALDALHHLRRRGVPVVLVSNAPRRIEAVRPHLRMLGIADDLYAAFYTSGEAVWQNIAAKNPPAYSHLGTRVYAIMAARDHGFVAGLDLTPVENIDAADFILALGVKNAHDRVEDFDDVLRAARARDLPLVCANPDLLVHRGGIAEICAGALAEAYAALGGRVIIARRFAFAARSTGSAVPQTPSKFSIQPFIALLRLRNAVPGPGIASAKTLSEHP